MPVCSDNGGDIFDCIQRGDIELCIQCLQNDRSVLKQTGWGGFTPLHYAALHGTRSLVDLFLGNGADPNRPCDGGQTAFHFACRQGNIFIIHQMMQYGADLCLIDQQRKTSLHHAVTGGSIVAVHFLWETGMFRFSDTDMYQVTPLHLAASTSNTEVVRYLLRDHRCSVDALDREGSTALHVAAEMGGVEVCWTLLQRTGCRILHHKNHSGLTPLDLSKQGKTFRHQQLTKLLRRYNKEPIHHQPRESPVLYFWTLCFPTVSGAAILLIAAMMGGYGALTCGLLFPWLARSIFSQYHRMTTYQRLPNPIYLGTLIAGLFHSLLCFYGKMMLSVWSNSVVVHVSMVHFSVVLILFCKVLIQDPGTLERADADPRFSCIADLVENNESPHRFCPYCELFVPDYTKHCKLCEVCIKDYDHHCLFLNRCIGRSNHRLFLIFILSMAVAHLLFVATATSYLYDRMPVSNYRSSSWLTLFGEEFWVVVMMTMNVLTLLWEVWLLIEQFDAVATGTSTYFRQCESSARQRSLSERWVVVLSFLLEGRRRVGRGQIREDKTAIDI
ncbi:putative ZDHHC-type palmitoyltransferase 6 isoform X1 [Pseudoliparis swirei]|uniref:putative ZDHHC-type palmitoyltransferase 6 isoform X1 n=2 Tax=Pseudoliparis swirei TaxID=2059687 RepID=UPI0024BE2CE9|nr:putative ZDHHC-type palmitoyltransferase 6 isoform X1 [Pseudoliparis swirei]